MAVPGRNTAPGSETKGPPPNVLGSGPVVVLQAPAADFCQGMSTL
jgi:hypothetical protein